MRAQADFSIEDGAEGQRVLHLSGPLTVAGLGRIDNALRNLGGNFSQISIARAMQFDTVGAWVVWRLADESGAPITGASKDAQRLIDAVSRSENDAETKAERLPLLPRIADSIGSMTRNFVLGALGMTGFFGQIVKAVMGVIARPSTFRLRALVRQMELVGVSALPIVGLMCFLVGIVIAQVGAEQLRQFGAEFYTVNLTGRLALRELGVLMTAIMVAGRSGSAFAAQIGTMKLTEEVDAMRTIGVSPIEALVLPRILAGMIMMPLLGFFASGCAIMGGAVISSLTLDIPMATFLARIQEVVPIHDFYVGMLKAPLFGLIVALSGCYQGMQVENNAEEVGLRTTAAVVQAIFMVIVLDAFFAVFFAEIGWG